MLRSLLPCLLAGLGASGAPESCKASEEDAVSLIQVAPTPPPHSHMEWHVGKTWEAFVNNLGGTGPLSGTEELRFHNVSVYYVDMNMGESGTMLDLLVHAVSPYANNQDPNKNGGHGEFGAIQFNPESGTVFRWSFVKMDTYEKVVIPDFVITFFDLDQQTNRPPCDENITAWNVHSYGIVPDSFTRVTIEDVDRLLVCSNTPGSVSNPRTVNGLSSDQKKAAVILAYQNTAEFELSLRNNWRGRRKFQFSGPSTAMEESVRWFEAHPTAAPTAAPTKSPTGVPTPSPTSAPTAAEPTAFGDPHVMNTAGEKFDIQRAGSHTFLSIPRGVGVENADLQVQGYVDSRGDACWGQHYITELSFTGKWLGTMRNVSFYTGTEEFNSLETVGLRVAESGNISIEEFVSRIPPEMLQLVRFHPKQPTALNQHVATLAATLKMGLIKVKVTWQHTKEKVGFSNSLMLVVSGLGKVQGSIGGLLGEDSHRFAASALPECSAGHVLLQRPRQNGVRAIALVDDEEQEDDE